MPKDLQAYDEERLLALMKNDNQFAFSEIYNRYWDRLYIVAGNKMEDAFLAQEIVQDIFVDLWERRHSLNIQYTLLTYLSAALKYRIINARNKITRQQYILKDIDENIYGKTNAEMRIEFEELQTQLAKQVSLLPEKCKLIYTLSRDEGYKAKDIAQKLNISEKTVEAHITRALKKLKNGLHLISSLIKHIRSFSTE